ncbi:MAG TPA: hypothetical protein VMS64_15570, partial [Candidatus Methylomirabilis sp.]|nr:hypothetical protein [Candidatus Methylomirabilis sp.]
MAHVNASIKVRTTASAFGQAMMTALCAGSGLSPYRRSSRFSGLDNDTGLAYGVEGTRTKRIGVVGKSTTGPGVRGECRES